MDGGPIAVYAPEQFAIHEARARSQSPSKVIIRSCGRQSPPLDFRGARSTF